MNIDDLTIKEAREISAMFNQQGKTTASKNKLIGEYVIVRCRDAGVHAGTLESAIGRECFLTSSRRLWYWKPANGAAFLSGVATEGLHKDSKVGAPVDIMLTENCEIIACSPSAVRSIAGIKNYEK